MCSGQLALKYKLDNEFELVFVVAYQKMLPLLYLDKLLDELQLRSYLLQGYGSGSAFRVKSWIRIRIRVRSWIQIRIKIKIQELFEG